MGLYEIHCHTAEVSVCGKVKAKEVVKLHSRAGFEGICITDHYFRGYFDNLGALSWEKKTDEYLQGYRLAKAEGEKTGLNVFLGLEIRFDENTNDYLVFGVEEKMLYENPRLYEIGVEGFYEFAKEENLLLVQAHPYRDRMTRTKSGFLHGIEAFNANPRQDSRNHLAKSHAEKNRLIKTGGSDFHRECDLFMAAMNFKRKIHDSEDLVNAIRAGEYRIIDNSEESGKK